MIYEIRCPHCGSKKIKQSADRPTEWVCESCSFLTDNGDLKYVEFEALVDEC